MTEEPADVTTPVSQPTRRSLLRGISVGVMGVAGASTLAACTTSGGGDDKQDEQEVDSVTREDTYDYSPLKGKTVGLVGVTITTEAIARFVTKAKELASENDFELDVVDTKGDIKSASDTLKVFADKGYAGAITASVDPNLLKDGSAALVSANIPFVGCFAGNGPNLAFDTTSNEWVSGARIATYVQQRIEAQGRDGGVAIITYTAVPAVAKRAAAWKAVLDFYDIPVIEQFEVKIPGQVVDTQRITNDLLVKYPENGKLLAVLGGWDELGLSASDTIKKAGRSDVFVASIDGNRGVIDAIRNDEPQGATVANDMTTIGSACLGELANLVAGGEPPAPTIYVDAPLVVKANVPAEGVFPVGSGVTPYYTG